MHLPTSSADAASLAEAPLLRECEQAVEATRSYLVRAQKPEGFWVGELEGDTILESEYIMFLFFLDQRVTPKMHKLAEYLRRAQIPTGGWNNYPGGPADVSVSVKAYFTLKLVGDSPDAPHMVKARETILWLGGVTACNTFTKFNLAFFGQYEWDHVPAIPPELILLPKSAYINIWAMSSWSRAMVITMAIIWHFKPNIPVPDHACIDELFVGGRDRRKGALPFDKKQPVCWRNFFLTADRVLKVVEGSRVRPMRARALKLCEEWMLEHTRDSDGIGAIFPPMLNTVMALRCLGYPDDHPAFVKAMREVEELEIEEEDTLRMQPCFSPVWDTALSLVCLEGAGTPGDHPAIQKAVRWLFTREARKPGDIHQTRSHPIGGWYFEFANEFYPDVDDTTMVLMGLDRARLPEGEDHLRLEAMDRGVKWMLSMQCRNGGWAAFDVDNDRKVLEAIPFADHNAMLDPPTADITARVLEALARFGYSPSDYIVERAIEFLKREQEPEGCWYGRWGVNYLYGTWQVLRGLEAIGANMSESWIQNGAAWLRSVQNPDGGWGETIRTYDDPSLKGQGQSTASQTAWALMGLISSGDYDSASVQRGIRYLLEQQKSDGTWYEEPWTGTGFPKVFYLKYHMYQIYFPMYALGMYRAAYLRGRAGSGNGRASAATGPAPAPTRGSTELVGGSPR